MTKLNKQKLEQQIVGTQNRGNKIYIIIYRKTKNIKTIVENKNFRTKNWKQKLGTKIGEKII